MPEIRLAVCHPDGTEVARVAARLRGAAVEPCADPAPLLAAGVHVLLVADPCPSADVIESLHGTARRAGAQLAVVNPDRYLPSRQLIRSQLPAPLGEPGLIRLHRWEPAAADHPSGLPEPLLRDLDVVLWLMGRRPECAYAVEQPEAAGGRYLQVHLGFPGGGMALLDFTGRLPPGDGYRSLSVIASGGAAYADDHHNTQLLYRGGAPQAVCTEEHAGVLAAVAQEFVEALRAGRDLTAGAAEWRDVFAVADAARRSLSSGRAVSPEDCG